jgi:16S rRNA (guanine(1405)-N(7))-methyltransferase
MSDLDQVVSTVASSKKYRMVCPDTIRRIAQAELASHHSIKVATKATKRRLHQVYGAFETGSDLEVAYQRLEDAYRTGQTGPVQAVCRQLLAGHSSTRERLSVLEQFYPEIWTITGHPASILDVGCGLNPLAWPWMDLPPSVRYIALDIDRARVSFLNRYLKLAGLEPAARCQDVLAHAPADEVDVALLLKMSPTLERQQAGATLDLIGRLRSRFVVVSYAVRSLGGREKGMVDHYRRQFSTWAAERNWPVETRGFESELVFVVLHQASAGHRTIVHG